MAAFLIFDSPTLANRIRLDVFLVDQLGISRSRVSRLIQQGKIFVNSLSAKKAGLMLKKGEIIEIRDTLDNRDNQAIQAIQKNQDIKDLQDIVDQIEIVAETPEYIVVNKPAGLLVHQTKARESDTLVSWLINHYPEIKNVGEVEMRAGLVHRLDKEASGLLVVARTQTMYDYLKKQFQARIIEKEYLVLVNGQVNKNHDIIDFAISRGEKGKMVARPKIGVVTLRNVSALQTGKDAKTEFWVEKRLVNLTLLTVKIHTGRMHQIRVHLYAYNHPVFGDRLYQQKKKLSKNKEKLDRLFLHATHLCFVDLSSQKVCFDSALPQKLKLFLESSKELSAKGRINLGLSN